MVQRTVTVTNISKTETFEDAWGGTVYRIGPGQSAVVPEGVAYHWLGDPSKTGPDAAVERRRVLDRAGGRDPNKILIIGTPPAKTKAVSSKDGANETADELFKLTNAQLHEQLAAAGVQFDKNAKKSDLVAALRAHLDAQATAGNSADGSNSVSGSSGGDDDQDGAFPGLQQLQNDDE